MLVNSGERENSKKCSIIMCIFAILTSVVGASYYLYVIKHMFFEKSDYINSITLSKIININSVSFTLSN